MKEQERRSLRRGAAIQIAAGMVAGTASDGIVWSARQCVAEADLVIAALEEREAEEDKAAENRTNAAVATAPVEAP